MQVSSHLGEPPWVRRTLRPVFTRTCGLAGHGSGTHLGQADSRVTHTASLEGRLSGMLGGTAGSGGPQP